VLAAGILARACASITLARNPAEVMAREVAGIMDPPEAQTRLPVLNGVTLIPAVPVLVAWTFQTILKCSKSRNLNRLETHRSWIGLPSLYGPS